MWFRTVFYTSVLVTSVLCAIDNDIPDDSLQDLVTRSKKSPGIFSSQEKKTWSKPEDMESGLDLKSVIVEDIRKEVEELKKLDAAYQKVKSEYLNQKKNESSKDQGDLVANVDKNTNLEDYISTDGTDKEDESVRPARQGSYMPLPGYHQEEYHKTQHSGMPPAMMSGGIPHSMGMGYGSPPHMVQNYQEVNKKTIVDGYGERRYPMLRAVQYIPSARTYGAAGIQGEVEGGYKTEANHIPPGKTIKQLKQLIPNVINVLSEIIPPPKPEANVHGHHEKKPIEHAIIHPPVIGHTKDKKGLSLPPVFYSKHIAFGVGTDKKIGDKHYGGGYYPSYPHQPQGYYAYSSPSSWYPQGHTLLTPSLYPEGGFYYSPYPEAYGYSSGVSAQAHSSPTTTISQGQDKTYFGGTEDTADNTNTYRVFTNDNRDNKDADKNIDLLSQAALLGLVNEDEQSLDELKLAIVAEKKKIEEIQGKLQKNDDDNDGLVKEEWKILDDDLQKSKVSSEESESKQDMKTAKGEREETKKVKIVEKD